MALLVPVFWMLSVVALTLGSQLECSFPLSCDYIGAEARWFRAYAEMSMAVFGAALLFTARIQRAAPALRLSAGVGLLLSLCLVGTWAWTADLLFGLQLL